MICPIVHEVGHVYMDWVSLAVLARMVRSVHLVSRLFTGGLPVLDLPKVAEHLVH